MGAVGASDWRVRYKARAGKRGGCGGQVRDNVLYCTVVCVTEMRNRSKQGKAKQSKAKRF